MRKFRQYNRLYNINSTEPFSSVYPTFADFIPHVDVREVNENYVYFGSANCNYIYCRKSGYVFQNFGWHGKSLFEKLSNDKGYENFAINLLGYLEYHIENSFDSTPADDYKIKRLTGMMDKLCSHVLTYDTEYQAHSLMQGFLAILYKYSEFPSKAQFNDALEYYIDKKKVWSNGNSTTWITEAYRNLMK